MSESPLYLLEPSTPGPEWVPFAGVRPIAELRAGAWRIRERWEAALRMDVAAIIGGPAEGFVEGDEPPCRLLGPVEGPAVVALSTFAPSGMVPEVAPGTRRLTHEGRTVCWIVAPGETWSRPHEEGSAAPIDGLVLRATYDLLTALERFLVADRTDFLAAGDQDPIPDGSIILGDPAQVIPAWVARSAGRRLRRSPGTRRAGVGGGGSERNQAGRSSLRGPSHSTAGWIHPVLGLWSAACRPRRHAASVFIGFANKGHDGFAGHSVLGHWVNRAGTTTSEPQEHLREKSGSTWPAMPSRLAASTSAAS